MASGRRRDPTDGRSAKVSRGEASRDGQICVHLIHTLHSYRRHTPIHAPDHPIPSPTHSSIPPATISPHTDRASFPEQSARTSPASLYRGPTHYCASPTLPCVAKAHGRRRRAEPGMKTRPPDRESGVLSARAGPTSTSCNKAQDSRKMQQDKRGEALEKTRHSRAIQTRPVKQMKKNMGLKKKEGGT